MPHGFPPATEKEYINLGYRIIRAPNYNGWRSISTMLCPFDKKEVRQAWPMIDRNENGVISSATLVEQPFTWPVF
jgi:hypothetical protein